MEIEVDLRLWLPTFMHRDMFYIVAHIIDHTLYTLSSFFPILKKVKINNLETYVWVLCDIFIYEDRYK